jgi:hypothetical protein
MQRTCPRVPGHDRAPIQRGWTQESRDVSDRFTSRCHHIEFHKLYQEYRRWSHHCHRNAIEFQTWTRHEYLIPRERDVGFPSHSRSNERHFLDEAKAKVHRAPSLFAGETNLSARAASTTSTTQFATTLLNMGIQLGQASQTLPGDMLFHIVSPLKIIAQSREGEEAESNSSN